MTKLIAWLTVSLVLLIALISFALSYHALQAIAQDYGLSGWLSYLWPLLIDLALVVFSLCVVKAHLHNESTWREWSLVIGCTLATIIYNYLHAPANLIAQSVAVVPPVMLFFSFELLAMQLKNSIQRTHKVQQLTQQVQQLTLAIDDPVTTRRRQIEAMIADGRELTQKVMSKKLGVSLSTIRNDIKALNGSGKNV
jgi:Trp operon repressor